MWLLIFFLLQSYYNLVHGEGLCLEDMHTKMTFLVAQLVKNLPTMWETWLQSLGWEDPLEKEKATHSSILAWRIPWGPWIHVWGDPIQSMGSLRVGHDWATFTFSHKDDPWAGIIINLSFHKKIPGSQVPESQPLHKSHNEDQCCY